MCQDTNCAYILAPCMANPCLVGEKVVVRWLRGYLISVIYGGRGGAARSAAKPGSKDIVTLSVYDIQNQFVGESLLSSILSSMQ